MLSLRARLLCGFTTLAAITLASSAWAGDITLINVVNSGGYTFTNFDGPAPNSQGTTINGISNTGTIVGFTTSDDINYNFTANPLTSTAATVLNINNSGAAMANGINSAGTIVGTDGNNNAFFLGQGGLVTFIPNGGTSATAFGINDQGTIVGQYTTTGAAIPGFALSGQTVTTINAPSGPDQVNAQGINNNGLVVGFYVGTDGQDHGFEFNLNSAVNHVGTGTAIADPTIPSVPGEPGATFVFSQILGINDQGIAVGYYGDSTTSQHGFIYNTNTGQYTFLDDPSEGFSNGVEVTQITGINNADEITGFYTDANGVAHGFVASLSSVPEPTSVALLGMGMMAALGYSLRRQRIAC
jgi:PEP-CTERM motif